MWDLPFALIAKENSIYLSRGRCISASAYEKLSIRVICLIIKEFLLICWLSNILRSSSRLIFRYIVGDARCFLKKSGFLGRNYPETSKVKSGLGISGTFRLKDYYNLLFYSS